MSNKVVEDFRSNCEKEVYKLSHEIDAGYFLVGLLGVYKQNNNFTALSLLVLVILNKMVGMQNFLATIKTFDTEVAKKTKKVEDLELVGGKPNYLELESEESIEELTEGEIESNSSFYSYIEQFTGKLNNLFNFICFCLFCGTLGLLCFIHG